LTLLVVALVTTGFVSVLPNLESDNSTESLLRPGDPAAKIYREFRKQFGNDEIVMLALSPPEIFDPEFLLRLRDLHRALEHEVPHLQDINSLINARDTRGVGDTLLVEDLMEDWPETPEDLGRLEARVGEIPLFENVLINTAGTVTTVMVKPNIYSSLGEEEDALAGFDSEASDMEDAAQPVYLSGAEKFEMIDRIKEVIARFDAPEFRLLLAGGAVMNYHATRMMMRDLSVFLPACIAIMLVLLFVVFRRLSGVVLPMLAVLCAVLVTYGIMAKMGIPNSITNQILPMLLITVGICSAVHILTIVYQQLELGANQEDAIAAAFGHSGVAVCMATLTTAGGLVSFVSADLAQVANLGKTAPIGILLTLVYCMTMLPALLSIFPLAGHSKFGGDALRARLSGWVTRIGDQAAEHPGWILSGTAVVLMVFATGLAELRFANDPRFWFPEEDEVRRAIDFMDRELHSGNGIEIIIDTGRENGLHDPEIVKRIEKAIEFAESYEYEGISVTKTISILDVVKETHKALNENRHDQYAIPVNRALLEQEMLLFENSGSDDLEELTDNQFRLARVSIRTPTADGMQMLPFIEGLERGFREILGDEMGVKTTGLGALFSRTFSIVNPTMAKSYALALLIITPMMILLIGSFKRGLLAMVPNLVPIWMTLGLMGWLDIPLDNSSLLIGCMIIGLAVDDTIHFMHKFQRYYSSTHNARTAVRETLRTTGSALLFTSLILAGGFSVMLLAYMNNAAQFGLLTAFGTLSAFFADILISPALMVLATRGKEKNPSV